MDNNVFDKMARRFDNSGVTLNPDVEKGGLIGRRVEGRKEKLERHSKGDLEGMTE